MPEKKITREENSKMNVKAILTTAIVAIVAVAAAKHIPVVKNYL